MWQAAGGKGISDLARIKQTKYLSLEWGLLQQGRYNPLHEADSSITLPHRQKHPLALGSRHRTFSIQPQHLPY
ncbi:unnamed protein product [Chondrus crispus]|uniref:Uncharacterized protein n=1 Tax=Chondrus crispus TaxID=2769 RepID=R7QAN4_CHOCR|nr:unnamed protein product [Chondrus crispus]CDF35129.1 unnamed protein product [Chondrus crispus]|eukprot:XP_005714948.1 unnamed protein product [Chondrus crispus]